MDFVKREESNIMDEENYKIYMENVSTKKNIFVFADIMNVKFNRLLSYFILSFLINYEIM